MRVGMKDHELLQQVPRAVSAMAKSYPSGYLGYAHSHARAQFLYAASGSMRLTFAEGCWVIPPQRAVWLPPGYVHQTSTIGELEMRTLYIREDSCPSIAPQQPRMLGVSPLLRELILRIVGMPQDYDEQGQDGRIIATALGEIDWTPLDPVRLPPLGDARLRRMEQMLNANPADASTLGDWAERLRVSTRTLARLIRQETALSFQVWRDHIRTFAAIPMLAEGRPLIEIAVAVGYETAWSFTAMFKRVTGTLPSRYAAEMSKKEKRGL
ncbi:AraC family transcriptional regulator [Silvibacterium sp.]|uniref:AraC family transcriptional regulator n=1 Tax=Silvibacterium sp. TaxID=1964179 RepID=UPI0039E591A4